VASVRVRLASALQPPEHPFAIEQLSLQLLVDAHSEVRDDRFDSEEFADCRRAPAIRCYDNRDRRHNNSPMLT
jgi:hypothetical protein